MQFIGQSVWSQSHFPHRNPWPEEFAAADRGQGKKNREAHVLMRAGFFLLEADLPPRQDRAMGCGGGSTLGEAERDGVDWRGHPVRRAGDNYREADRDASCALEAELGAAQEGDERDGEAVAFDLEISRDVAHESVARAVEGAFNRVGCGLVGDEQIDVERARGAASSASFCLGVAAHYATTCETLNGEPLNPPW